MTLYTGIYDNNGHGLTMHVSFMVKHVCYTGLWIHWFCEHSVAIIPISSVITGLTSLVSVGHSRLDSVMYR
jgi:hypothetical protein